MAEHQGNSWRIPKTRRQNAFEAKKPERNIKKKKLTENSGGNARDPRDFPNRPEEAAKSFFHFIFIILPFGKYLTRLQLCEDFSFHLSSGPFETAVVRDSSIVHVLLAAHLCATAFRKQ